MYICIYIYIYIHVCKCIPVIMMYSVCIYIYASDIIAQVWDTVRSPLAGYLIAWFRCQGWEVVENRTFLSIFPRTPTQQLRYPQFAGFFFQVIPDPRWIPLQFR